MKWMCAIFEEQSSGLDMISNISAAMQTIHYRPTWNETINSTKNITDGTNPFILDEANVSDSQESRRSHDLFENIVLYYVVPIICSFGILGNSMNSLILGKKMSKGLDRLEKGATIGLLALAISDLAFCVAMVIIISVPHNELMFRSKSLSFYVALYGTFVINILIKVSTWYIVVLNLGRYFAVCFPIQARRYMKYSHTVFGLALGTVFWILVHLPMLWTWRVSEVDCSDISPNLGKIYALRVGDSKHLKILLVFEYIWAITGVFIPAIILAYCNVKLVQSLRKSSRMKEMPGIKRNHQVSDPQRRISIILISIALLFFLLMFPSEVTRFYVRIGMYYILIHQPWFVRTFIIQMGHIIFSIHNRHDQYIIKI